MAAAFAFRCVTLAPSGGRQDGNNSSISSWEHLSTIHFPENNIGKRCSHHAEDPPQARAGLESAHANLHALPGTQLSDILPTEQFQQNQVPWLIFLHLSTAWKAHFIGTL